eukprot:GHRR01016985.1.p1 GENE.GHRR01016985.1~~GHRR01016985.1.p1  ORF type:complete len:198 (+),score=59.44 GHRR01016985.1:266-859(+)
MSGTLDYEALPQREGLRSKRRRKDNIVAAEQQPSGTNEDNQQADEHARDRAQHGQESIQAHRSAAVGQHKFEWGSSLQEALQEVGLAMFNYMTPIDELSVDEACTREVSVSGHDMHSLLFNYLDELLFVYSAEYIMMKHINITKLNEENFTITATGHGEKFDRSRHECGTEVKAITYSAMQIHETEGDAEIFVIVDI